MKQTEYYVKNSSGGYEPIHFVTDANIVNINDAGNLFSSVETEGALQEIGYNLTSKASEDSLAIERARIDEMQTIPEGGTSADTALSDIKVSAGGKTYDTPGNAVRAQVGILYDYIAKVNNKIKVCKNKFNKNDVVNGYYLLFNTGLETPNANMCHSMPIEYSANTVYYLNQATQICFFDKYGNYKSGTLTNQTYNSVIYGNTFTTPATDGYLIISVAKASASATQLEVGSVGTAYENYYEKLKYGIDLFDIIVDVQGNGNYTTLTQAVANANDGDRILVMPGVYDNEIVQAWEKTLYITGASKNHCIIKNHTGQYDNPPIEICSGLLENLTILAEYASGLNEYNSYGIHIESDYMANKTLTLKNLYVESQTNYAIGAGLRGGSMLEIIQCDLVGSAGNFISNHVGGLYFHDSPSAAYLGHQIAKIIDTNIYANSPDPSAYTMRVQSQANSQNSTTVIYNRVNTQNTNAGGDNIMFCNTDYDTNGNIIGKTIVDTFNQLEYFKLSKGSYGNRNSLINA